MRALGFGPSPFGVLRACSRYEERDVMSGSAARVVVGVDGSEQSKQALRWAGRIAQTFQATIQVVGAWHHPTSYGWSAVATGWDPEEDTAKCLTEAVEEVF